MTTDHTDDTNTGAEASEDTTVAADVNHGDTTTTDTEPAPTDNRREARYRRQLRDTEAERDQLADQLATMRRAEAEHIAAATIAKPAALWAAGIDLADLLGDDGNVDPAKVAAAAGTAREQLRLEAPRRNVVRSEGANPASARTTSFADAFSPR